MGSRGTSPGPARRDAAGALLQDVVEVVNRKGFNVALSMRGLAAELGVAHRLLAYHFGSWSGLLAALLNALRAQEKERVLAQVAAGRTRAEMFRTTWVDYLDPSQVPRSRMFFIVLGHALADPQRYAAFLESTQDWISTLTAVGVEEGRDAATAEFEARYVSAVMRGLILDLQLTGDLDFAKKGGDLLYDTVFGRSRSRA